MADSPVRSWFDNLTTNGLFDVDCAHALKTFRVMGGSEVPAGEGRTAGLAANRGDYAQLGDIIIGHVISLDSYIDVI